MTALLVMVWAVVGCIAGGAGLTELAGISSREGAAGYFAVFIAGPLGAIGGGIFGYVLARIYAGRPKVRRRLAGIPLAALALVAAAAFGIETFRTWDLLENGPKSLAYRVRLPAGAATPAGQRAGFELRSDKESVTCKTYDAPQGLTQEEGRWILSGECQLAYATPKRVLWVRIGEGPNLLFRLHAKARFEVVPYSASAWYPVDEVQDIAQGSAPRAPKPEEAGYEVLLSAR